MTEHNAETVAAQSQGSLTHQFWKGHKIVTLAGLYDLADWMAARWFGPVEDEQSDGSES